MMKRASVLLLALVLVASSRAEDVPDTKPEAEARVSPLKGKTAYVNLTLLLKGYTRYQNFASDMKAEVTRVENKMKKLKTQLDTVVREVSQPDVTPEDREKGQKMARDLQRQLEDLTNEGKIALGRSSDSLIVEMYKDVHDVISTYARQEGLEAVLHYADARPGTPEFMTPANVSRKMQAGATIPIYLAPGFDITEALLDELNKRYKKQLKD